MATAIVTACAHLHNWCIAHRAPMRRFVNHTFANNESDGAGNGNPIFTDNPGGRPGTKVADARKAPRRIGGSLGRRGAHAPTAQHCPSLSMGIAIAPSSYSSSTTGPHACAALTDACVTEALLAASTVQ